MSLPAVAAAPVIEAPVTETGRRVFWRSVFGTAEGRVGLALGIIVLAVIIFGPLVAPYSPTKIGFLPNQGPSSENLLGTDSLGRDVLSRFLNGGRSVLVIPLIAVTLSTIIGGLLGMLSAYKGGRFDMAFGRVVDLMLALPALLMVLVLIAGFGQSNLVIVVSVVALFAPQTARIIRSATQNVVTDEYVVAAQARGERTPAILLREVLPNISAPAIAEYALRLTWAVIFVSTLSFLGLGQQPPSSDWGLMISQNRAYLSLAPLGTLAPAVGIALIAIALNLIAEAMTKRLDPMSSNRGAPV